MSTILYSIPYQTIAFSFLIFYARNDIIIIWYFFFVCEKYIWRKFRLRTTYTDPLLLLLLLLCCHLLRYFCSIEMNQISSFTIRFVGNGCWIPRAQSKQHWVVGQHKYFVHKISNCLVKLKKRTHLLMIWIVNHHSIFHSTLTIICFFIFHVFLIL